MQIEDLSQATQEGLRAWGVWQHNDALLFEGISNWPEEWAWIVIQLRLAEDRPAWFPKGKWSVIQVIEERLNQEATTLRDER